MESKQPTFRLNWCEWFATVEAQELYVQANPCNSCMAVQWDCCPSYFCSTQGVCPKPPEHWWTWYHHVRDYHTQLQVLLRGDRCCWLQLGTLRSQSCRTSHSSMFARHGTTMTYEKIKRGGSIFCFHFVLALHSSSSRVIKLCVSWPCFGVSEAEGIFSLDVGESVMSYMPQQREATLESKRV